MEYETVAVLNKVMLGVIIGSVGQSIRAVIGLKKASDTASMQGRTLKEVFDSRQFVVSLVIGGAAGSLAALALLQERLVSTEDIFVLLAAGYGGADFIEGFIRSHNKSLAPTLPNSVVEGPSGPMLASTPTLPRPNPFSTLVDGATLPQAESLLPRTNPFPGSG